MSAPKILVLVTDGTEDMEAVTIVDVLRRAKTSVLVCSLEKQQMVECSNGICLVPDTCLSAIKPTDMADMAAIILPGGLRGAKAFAESKAIHDALTLAYTSGKLVAAICAAPIALVAAGIGRGKQLTSHPSIRDQLATTYKYSEDRVVVDGNLITSRGPGTALEFSLSIVEYLLGRETRNAVAAPMCIH
ncbi:hypothetical protein BASA61_008525 [Batrachochytrium salamandrivorans]|nr:hypothetical protein BASA61_008525 [Batrachochytrium salamandrivorans]KAH9269856.1 hypothetical protein BASA83_008004 [Batrachochytrium salamandrivorans]